MYESNNSLRYWLWLSLALPAGSSAGDKLLSHFGNDPVRIYNAEDQDYSGLDLSVTTLSRLLNKDLGKTDEILDYCRQNDVFLLTPGNAGYPERLLRISRMPLVLYCKGKLPDIDREACIAMVGTRRMTSYGKRMAYEIAYDLARAGAIVVSGLALGVDAVAHRACLDAGGFTVAVLGCGIDVTYPKENFEILCEIERKGLVMTEYPPGTRPFGANFPTRNRIISGLCLGSIIIEADNNSGAMITADYAIKQKRDLFALPGMVGEQNSEGTNRLIREGATAVTDARDILSEYELLYPTKLHTGDIPAYRPKIQNDAPKTTFGKPKLKVAQKPKKENIVVENEPPIPTPMPQPPMPAPQAIATVPPSLDGVHADIYRTILALGEPSQDEIISQSGVGASNALVALTVLEIKGYITSLPGGRYSINKS